MIRPRTNSKEVTKMTVFKKNKSIKLLHWKIFTQYKKSNKKE